MGSRDKKEHLQSQNKYSVYVPFTEKCINIIALNDRIGLKYSLYKLLLALFLYLFHVYSVHHLIQFRTLYFFINMSVIIP
jgi:hypothetical protein